VFNLNLPVSSKNVLCLSAGWFYGFCLLAATPGAPLDFTTIATSGKLIDRKELGFLALGDLELVILILVNLILVLLVLVCFGVWVFNLGLTEFRLFEWGLFGVSP
jgi:hypothetical protein